MALWPARSTGILFGGVFDEDRGDEGMESVFYNDLWVPALCEILSLTIFLGMGIRQQEAESG